MKRATPSIPMHTETTTRSLATAELWQLAQARLKREHDDMRKTEGGA